MVGRRFNTMPEVVGITVHLTFARRAFALANWYRSRGSKVILGGLHVLSCPDECAPHADALALGDGVQLWPRILADVEAGRLRPRYAAAYENDYRDDPAPRRSILPRRSFLTTTSLIATRGCHNRCGFCYLATDGLRMPYRMRDPAQIAAEFASDGQPYAVFVDNNLKPNREYLRSLCQAAAANPRRSGAAAVTIDVTDDPSLVREMALAGCTGVFVGFESLTDENLSDAKKKTPKTADYARRVRLLHDQRRSRVNGSFVLGFDHDRPDVFARTARMDRAEPSGVPPTFHILTPYPATPLFTIGDVDGRPPAAPQLGSVRYGARGVSAPFEHMSPKRNWNKVTRGFTSVCSLRFHLAAAAGRLARGGAVSRDVVFIQAVERVLASADQASSGTRGVASAGGTYTGRGTYDFRKGLAENRHAARGSRKRGDGGRLAYAVNRQ